MKVYISGKISGLHYNEAAFNFSINENILNAMGHHSVNPMSRKYFKNRMGKLPWLVHMILDIILLLQCDAIFLQDNWTDSRGAKVEYFISKMFRMKVLEECELWHQYLENQ